MSGYELRQSLIDSVAMLSTLSPKDVGRFTRGIKDSDTLCYSPNVFCALEFFELQYCAWAFHYEKLLDAIDAEPLDELLRIVDDILQRRRRISWSGTEDDWEQMRAEWSDESIETGHQWRELRELAAAGLGPVNSLAVPEYARPRELKLPVEHSALDYVPNPLTAAELEEDDEGDPKWVRRWVRLRQETLYICLKYGHVGPDNHFPESDFWLVEDNQSDDRYVNVGILRPFAVTQQWLGDLVKVLRCYRGWGIGVSSEEDSYVLVFTNKLIVGGRPFQNCQSAGDVVTALRGATSAN